MTRFGKYLVKVCSVIIFLIIGIFFFVTLIFDGNSAKPIITKWVKDHYQRHIIFEGDLSFNFYPNVVIKIDGFSVSEYQQNKKFASAQQIYLSTPLSALLKAPWTIETISVSEIEADIIRFDDGRTNIDDLISTDEKASSLRFIINKLNIIDANLKFQDNITSKILFINQLHLTADLLKNHSLSKITIDGIGRSSQSDSPDNYVFDTHLLATELQWRDQAITSGPIHFTYQLNTASNNSNGSLSISNLFQDNDQLKSEKVELNLAFQNKQYSLAVALNTPLAGMISKRIWALPEIHTLFTVNNLQNPSATIKGESKGKFSLNLATETVQINNTGTFSESQFKSTLYLSPFSDTNADLYLWIDTLNLNDFDQFNPEANVTDRKELMRLEAIEQTQLTKKLNLDFLNKLNLSGKIHIGQLQIVNIQSHDIQFDLQSTQSNSLKNH